MPFLPDFGGSSAPLWWVYRMLDAIIGVSGGHARDLEWLFVLPVPGYVIVRQWDLERN